MTTAYQIVLCTCPDKDTAESISYLLIENNLAACVNIFPHITSIYRWQHEIERAEEWLLIIKTRQDAYLKLESMIKTHHPYQIPEIIAVPVTHGLPEYLHWIDTCH